MMDQQLEYKVEFESWAKLAEKQMPFDLRIGEGEGAQFYVSNLTNAAYCAYAAARRISRLVPCFQNDSMPEPTPDPTHLTAFDWGPPFSTGEFSFSIGKEESARNLHEIARMIEHDQIIAQKVEITSAAVIDDYSATTLTFQFVPRRPKP
jgi:hypothetical protein